MSGHDHEHVHDGGAAGGVRLRIALAATAMLAIVELAGGVASHSLALLSDAAHVTMDVVALGIALAASIHSKRQPNERQTFGFARLEILAALGNGALLLALTMLIVIEAVKRFLHPSLPEGALMVWVALFGLAVNIAIGTMLLRTARETLNLKAALLHVAGDALGAIAVIVGGAVILATGAAWIDPVLSLFVSAVIVAGVFGIVREATHVLLESAPDHARVPAVRASMRECDGVVDVHDLHVWTIGSGTHALAAHVVLDDRRISEATAVLDRINIAMHERFAIDHVTVQFECESCDDDDRIVCTQAPRSREAVSASGT